MEKQNGKQKKNVMKIGIPNNFAEICTIFSLSRIQRRWSFAEPKIDRRGRRMFSFFSLLDETWCGTVFLLFRKYRAEWCKKSRSVKRVGKSKKICATGAGTEGGERGQSFYSVGCLISMSDESPLSSWCNGWKSLGGFHPSLICGEPDVFGATTPCNKKSKI